jgi:AraC-like DNA-binding protein
MPGKIAIFDEARSFFRYLVVSQRDRDWGLFVTGTGHEVLTVTGAAAARRRPYRYAVEADSSDAVSITWDPTYPQPYRYDFNQGRTLVDEFGLLYIDSGAAWIFESEASGQTIRVEPGSVVLLFPEVWHRYRPQLGDANQFSSTFWCTFGGDTARRWQARGLITPSHPVLHVGSDPGLEMGFRRLHSHVQSRDPSCLQPKLASSLWELLGHADAATRTVEPTISPDVIERAKIILEDLSLANAGPEDVSRMLNLPYNQFRRSFKLATGVSPHQYRLQMLLRRAKELLEATDMSIKQIAVALYFTDQYYFAKAFRRRTGMSPTQWRSRSRRKSASRRG